MNWEAELLALRFGGSSMDLASCVAQQPEEIHQLIKAAGHSNHMVAWRAAWVLDNYARNHQAEITKYTDQLSELLVATKHNGVRRHLTRILCDTDPALIDDGRVVDLCFEWISNPTTPVAVQANAMSLLAGLCNIYPDLAKELETVINDNYIHGSAGFKSRCRKILKQLNAVLKADD